LPVSREAAGEKDGKQAPTGKGGFCDRQDRRGRGLPLRDPDGRMARGRDFEPTYL